MSRRPRPRPHPLLPALLLLLPACLGPVDLPLEVASPWSPGRPIPWLLGRVRGTPVPLLLDSGAQYPFLSHAVAWGLGITADPWSGVAEDGGGFGVGAGLAEEPDWEVPGIHPDRLPVPAVVFSRPLADSGIWGGIPPQALLQPGERARIDLTLRRFEVAAADRLPVPDDAEPLQACRRDRDSTHGSPVYLADAVVLGRPLRLLVDTGASGFVVYDDAPAAAPLRAAAADPVDGSLPMARHVTLGGVHEVVAVPPTPAALAGFDGPVPIDLVPRLERSDCKEDGVVGFELLRFCTLWFEPDRGAVRCRSVEGDDASVPVPDTLPPPGPPVRLVAVESLPACGFDASDLLPTLTGGTLPAVFPGLLRMFAALAEDASAFRDSILAACADRGYLDAVSLGPPLLPAETPGDYRLRFAVAEGPRIRVSAVDYLVRDEDDRLLRRFDPETETGWRLRPGVWFEAAAWDADAERMEQILQVEGWETVGASDRTTREGDSVRVESVRVVRPADGGGASPPARGSPRGGAYAP